MSAIELGYAKEIWLGDKKVAYVYLGDKVVYPAIIGYEDRTDYTAWVYSITTTSGTRTRNWTSYKRAKYGNGTFGEWEQTGSGVNNETGTQSTSEVNTSGWTYAITFDTGYRTQTYQIRYTYTFSDATQYVDSVVQTRRQDATRTIYDHSGSAWSYNWTLPANNSTRSQTYYTRANYTFSDGETRWIDSGVLTRVESGANGVAVIKLKLINIPTWTLPANGAAISMNSAVDYIWGGTVITSGGASKIGATASNSGGVSESGTVVNIWRINNTSTNTQQVQVQLNRWDLTSSDVYTFTQAAGVVHWGQPVITAFGYPDMPASGGTIGLNSWNWYQPYTWNGVAGSGGTQNSSGIAYFSQGNTSGEFWAGSKGTTASDRTYIYTSTARVDANGVTGPNATAYIYQQANSATRTSSSCSGYTYTEHYTWTSGATSSWSQENSSACGYTPTSFRLDAQLVTDWYTVQNIIGQDYADLEWWCGDMPDDVHYQIRGRWDASTSLVTNDVKGYKYAMGGVAQSGSGRFNWTVPAYVTITNKSGGLGLFYWNKDLPSGGGVVEAIPIAGRYT